LQLRELRGYSGISRWNPVRFLSIPQKAFRSNAYDRAALKMTSGMIRK
jgi:hypothetical protein